MDEKSVQWMRRGERGGGERNGGERVGTKGGGGRGERGRRVEGGKEERRGRGGGERGEVNGLFPPFSSSPLHPSLYLPLPCSDEGEGMGPFC